MSAAIKMASYPANRDELLGMHCPREVTATTRPLRKSFLAVDESVARSYALPTAYRVVCRAAHRVARRLALRSARHSARRSAVCKLQHLYGSLALENGKVVHSVE